MTTAIALTWEHLPGLAHEIALGADGSAWCLAHLRQLRFATTVPVGRCVTALQRWHYTAASFVNRPPAPLTN